VPTEISHYRLRPDEVTCGQAFTIELTAGFGCAQGNRLDLWAAGPCALQAKGQSGEVAMPVEAPGFDGSFTARLDCPSGTHAVVRVYVRATDCHGESHLRWRPVLVHCP